MASKKELFRKIIARTMCCLSSDNHVIEDAVALKCGGHACRQCAYSNKHTDSTLEATATATPVAVRKVNCLHCFNKHELNEEFQKGLVDIKEIVDLVIEQNLSIIYAELNKRFTRKREKIEDMELSNYVENVNNGVMAQVKAQIERIKSHFDIMYEEFAERMKSCKEQMLGAVQSATLEQLNDKITEKNNANSQNLNNLYDYQRLVLDYEEKTLNLVKNLPTADFVPNNSVFNEITSSFIGSIKTSFEKNTATTRLESTETSAVTSSGFDSSTSDRISRSSNSFEMNDEAEARDGKRRKISTRSPESTEAAATVPSSGYVSTALARLSCSSIGIDVSDETYTRNGKRQTSTASAESEVSFTDTVQSHVKESVAITTPLLFEKISNRQQLTGVDCDDVGRMCVSHVNQMVYISDYKNNRILTLNLIDSTIKPHYLNNELSQPWAMYFNDLKSQLFVADYEKRKIFVFNVENETITKLCEIGDKNLVAIDSIELDAKIDILYVSDSINDKITVWSPITGFIQSHKIESPSSLRVKDKYMYVTSHTEGDYEKPHNKRIKLVAIEKGQNCIFILDRFTWTLQKTIRLDDWFNPRGLYIDDDMNILTVALHKNKNEVLSNSEYLFVMDSNGNRRRKIFLNFDNVFDFCVCDKRLIFVRGTAINIPIYIVDFI